MNRILLALPVLVALLTTSANAEQMSPTSQTEPSARASNPSPSSSSATSADLRTWSIPNAYAVLEDLTSPYSCLKDIYNCKTGRGYYRVLMRPHREGVVGMLLGPHREGVVGIILERPNSGAILNPQLLGIDYGPIPSLTDITPEQADQLWGPVLKQSENSCERTYRVVSPPLFRNYFLDFVFDGKKLMKYRIRGGPQEGWQPPDAQ